MKRLPYIDAIKPGISYDIVECRAIAPPETRLCYIEVDFARCGLCPDDGNWITP